MNESVTSFTAEDYFSLLHRSGLLEDKLFEAQKKRYLSANASPKAIISQMVVENYLTPFQAKQLSERRHRGFFLSEKYKILDFLGQGGMSRVLLCEHLLLQRLVAVKVLNKSLDKFPGAAERFLREARASASMDHPNIARVFDVDRTGLGPSIVMEFVDGTNLHEIAVKHEILDINRVVHFIRQAAIGLQQAHQAGLVHRDIKPANLMLDRTGTVKLLDLGLARFFDPKRSDNLTQQIDASCIIGTADYIAPEQVMDSSSADIRADIYSLGCSMYFLLTRVLPAGEGPVMRKLLWHQTRHPEPIRTLRPEIPEELAKIIDRMIQKKPEDRYQTPFEVVTALEPWTKVPISPPSDEEMPKTKAVTYRLGLCPPPDGSRDTGATSAVSPMNSTIQKRSGRGSSAVRQDSKSGFGADSRGHEESTIGYAHPLGSGAVMPTGSTIRSSKTNEVMSETTETASTSGASYIRSLSKFAKENRELARRRIVHIAAIVVASIAFGVGIWATLWWQGLTQSKAASQTAANLPIATQPNKNVQAAAQQQKLPGQATAKPNAAVTGVVLRGSGSTFIRPVMEYWSNLYSDETGIKIEYAGLGSSKGVEALSLNATDFCCSDAFLNDKKIEEIGSTVVHIPLAMGAVVATYNVTNEAGEPIPVRFTGSILANIYLGKIKKWNDQGIAANNPGRALPDLDITVVYRKDGSGTTAIWTDYLCKVSSAWKSQVGAGNKVEWPLGVGADKSDGVADTVARTTGAIGYVEFNFALANSLAVGQVKNQAGSFIEPTIGSVTAAAAASMKSIPDDLRYSLTDAPGSGSYPIVGTCWAILRSDIVKDRRPEMVRFLKWATTDGQKHLINLHYGPLPEEFSAKIAVLLEKIESTK